MFPELNLDLSRMRSKLTRMLWNKLIVYQTEHHFLYMVAVFILVTCSTETLTVVPHTSHTIRHAQPTVFISAVNSVLYR